MTNPPTFTVAPTATRGQSLLQWPQADAPAGRQSLQMPTEIAEHLARLAAVNAKLTTELDNVAEWLTGDVLAAEMGEGKTELDNDTLRARRDGVYVALRQG